jgi:hypothetical protein
VYIIFEDTSHPLINAETFTQSKPATTAITAADSVYQITPDSDY